MGRVCEELGRTTHSRLMLLQHVLFGLLVLLHQGAGKPYKESEEVGALDLDDMDEVESMTPIKSIKEIKSLKEVKHITPIEEEVAREAIEKFRLKNMLSNEEEDGKYNAEMEELVEEEEEVGGEFGEGA